MQSYKTLRDAYEGAYPNRDTHYDIDAIQPCIQKIFAELVSPVLDVGCGSGALVHELAEQGHDATGIDYAESAIAIATSKTNSHSNACIIHGDFFDYSFEHNFKSIVDIGMIHNYNSSYYDVYIKKIYDLLQPAGIAHVFACANDNRAGRKTAKKITHTFNVNQFNEIACMHFSKIEKKSNMFLIKGRKTVKGFHMKLTR